MRLTNYQPPVPAWNSISVTPPPVGEVVLIHDGKPNSPYPVTAFVAGEGTFVRTDGTIYSDEGISFWMSQEAVPPPPPQFGEHQVETLPECAMLFDSMRGLDPVAGWEPKTDSRIKGCRTKALQHLSTDYTLTDNCAGAKHLGFEPIKAIVVLYVWLPPWIKQAGREEKGFTSDLLVVCRSPEGNPECLDRNEVLGTCQEYRPTQDEIAEECSRIPKDWDRQMVRQDILLNGRSEAKCPLTGEAFEIREELS